MRAKMGAVAAAAPEPAKASVAPVREYYTAPELALRWHVSPTTIRRWFRDEPGVIRWGVAVSRPGAKRAHQSLRIPLAAVERVRRRMSLS
jgi:hypothetical protein